MYNILGLLTNTINAVLINIQSILSSINQGNIINGNIKSIFISVMNMALIFFMFGITKILISKTHRKEKVFLYIKQRYKWLSVWLIIMIIGTSQFITINTIFNGISRMLNVPAFETILLNNSLNIGIGVGIYSLFVKILVAVLILMQSVETIIFEVFICVTPFMLILSIKNSEIINKLAEEFKVMLLTPIIQSFLFALNTVVYININNSNPIFLMVYIIATISMAKACKDICKNIFSNDINEERTENLKVYF